MRSDPQVVFADNFENGNLGEGWDEIGNKNGSVLSLVSPEADAPLGKRCLRVEAHFGKDTGGGLTRGFESSETVFVRFYVKFALECDYVHHFVTLRANKGLKGGEKWSGFGGAGIKPDGTERWTKNPTNIVFFDYVAIARAYLGPASK